MGVESNKWSPVSWGRRCGSSWLRLYTETEEIELEPSFGMTSLPQHATYFFSDGDVGPSLLFLHLNCDGVSYRWWALLLCQCPAPPRVVPATFTWNFFFLVSFLIACSCVGIFRGNKQQRWYKISQNTLVWKLPWIFPGDICRASPTLLMSVVSISESAICRTWAREFLKS